MADQTPRAPTSSGPVLLDGPVWNDAAVKIDRNDNITFSGRGVRVNKSQVGISVVFSDTAPSPVRRMKIKNAPDANGVAVCNTWDGTNAGTDDINVRVTAHHAVGQELFAVQVQPNTGVQKSSKDVVYLEHVSNPLFPVFLKKSSGDPGSDTEQCSYKYSLYADEALTVLLATELSPKASRRPTFGQLEEATGGSATYIGTTLTLWECHEPFKTDGTCSSGDGTDTVSGGGS